MTYRLLPIEEWDRLHGITQAGGFIVPDPSIGCAAVAEDDEGRIVAVLFFQLAAHMEPLIIERPGVNFLRLQQIIEDQVRSALSGMAYYAMSNTPETARMCEKAGMELTPYALWRKEVQ